MSPIHQHPKDYGFTQSSQRRQRTQRDLDESEIGTIFLNIAYQTHKELGPGLFESVYEAILVEELKEHGLQVEIQKEIPIYYKGKILNASFRADLVIENKVLIELKSTESLQEVHKKQIITYLKLSGLKLGYLVNFNSNLLKKGVFRFVNQLHQPNSPRSLPSPRAPREIQKQEKDT